MTDTVDAKELAEAFLKYRETYDILQAQEERLKSLVLLAGESQKIAGVLATYYHDTEKVDYESAAKTKEQSDDFHEAVNNHTELKPSVSWKGVCEELGVQGEKLYPFTTSIQARVVVKVK